MKVLEIVKLASMFAGKGEVVSALMTGVTPQPEVQEEIDKFVKCVNLVNQEIATDYIPLVFEEWQSGVFGKFEYVRFTKKVYEILKVTGSAGDGLRFKVFPTYMQTNINTVNVMYSYLPDVVVIGSDIDYPKLSESVFAYGVAMEYLLINTLSDEAQIWERRYRDGLFLASRKTHEKRLPKRRWV